MKKILINDAYRYGKDGKMPKFQKYYRLTQTEKFIPFKMIYRVLFSIYKRINLVQLYYQTEIGEGLYFGHPFCITINPAVTIGKNVNIHKGVTIGQENRGIRKGVPTIGNNVWIGVNSVIVGNITIGNDVLIAPNSYVNCDIPDHSIVFGNPCIVKTSENATIGYINRTVDFDI